MLVECVPNFSEGRNPAVLRALADAARSVDVKVLGLSADPDHNRSVMTIAGEGPAVLESVFRASRQALELIDLRSHQGSHPRMGAVDVVPFVPLDDTPMAYCVQLAEDLGRRFGTELQLPVYLYERAARRRERVNLARVRHPEYEGLSTWMQEEAHRPDFGPHHPHPTGGASAVGARW
ncbi:MAG: glutamate formimidoyltransferase, partial [Clostridia bacterium]